MALVEAAAADSPVREDSDPGSHGPDVVRSAVSTSADEAIA